MHLRKIFDQTFTRITLAGAPISAASLAHFTLKSPLDTRPLESALAKAVPELRTWHQLVRSHIDAQIDKGADRIQLFDEDLANKMINILLTEVGEGHDMEELNDTTVGICMAIAGQLELCQAMAMEHIRMREYELQQKAMKNGTINRPGQDAPLQGNDQVAPSPLKKVTDDPDGSDLPGAGEHSEGNGADPTRPV